MDQSEDFGSKYTVGGEGLRLVRHISVLLVFDVIQTVLVNENDLAFKELVLINKLFYLYSSCTSYQSFHLEIYNMPKVVFVLNKI